MFVADIAITIYHYLIWSVWLGVQQSDSIKQYKLNIFFIQTKLDVLAKCAF
jgi:hypothetical protein